MLNTIFIKKMAHKKMKDVKNNFMTEREKIKNEKKIKNDNNVDLTKCYDLVERNLTRNINPDIDEVRKMRKQRDEKMKTKGIPQIRYTIDMEDLNLKIAQKKIDEYRKFKERYENEDSEDLTKYQIKTNPNKNVKTILYYIIIKKCHK